MKLLKPLIIACLLLLPLLSFAADSEYGYPIADPYAATILGTPVDLTPKFPAGIRIRQLVLNVIPEREKPPVFFYDDGLRCSFVKQDKKAPLIFLIAGAGASNNATKLVSMMKAFYQAGFHVITLPSPTNSNFIISASQSRVPGDLTEDAQDLYRVMESAWNEVKGEIEVSDFNLCGYSMGGGQAAFISKLDEERGVFKFRKVLLINPVVNLYNSIMRFEDLLKKFQVAAKNRGFSSTKCWTGLPITIITAISSPLTTTLSTRSTKKSFLKRRDSRLDRTCPAHKHGWHDLLFGRHDRRRVYRAQEQGAENKRFPF